MNVKTFAFFLFCLGLFATARAEEGLVPKNLAQVHLTFAPIVARVRPSVVNVYASRVETMPRNPLFDDPFFRHFFGEMGEDSNRRVAQSLGSGVIVDKSGLVITNHHVIAGMTEMKISLTDKREFGAKIVLDDPRTDLAVLKIEGEDFPALSLGDSDALQVGDFVIAIGNPFGVGQSVTQGIVSALARTGVGVNDYGFFIQTDAAINPGNSGGALVDTWGRLVGVNSAIYSRSGGSMGIGFAIPVTMVRNVIAAAKMGSRRVRRPYLGAKLQDVTRDIAEALRLDRPAGAVVASVLPDTPAAQAGLLRGDVIVGVDEQPVDDAASVDFRIGVKPVGGAAALHIRRGDRDLTLSLRLQAAAEMVPRRPVRLIHSPLRGALVVNISPVTLEEFEDLDVTSGVVVTEVAPNSPAADFGLQRGDIVVEVNGEKIDDTQELLTITSQQTRAWDLTIVRAGQAIRSHIVF